MPQRLNIYNFERVFCGPRFAWGILILLIVKCAVFGEDANYDVAGTLQYDFIHEGKILRSTTNEFLAKVRGKGSSIKSWGIPNHGVADVKSYEHITDGVNSAFVTIFDVNPEEVERRQTTTLNEIYNSWVLLYSSELPPNHMGLMGPVWLATASSSFFTNRSKTNSAMWPLYFMGNAVPDIGSVQISASWSLGEQFPHLPKTIAEYANSVVFEMVNSNYMTWANKRLPSVYGAGYTNALFNVLEWTNIGHLQLPKIFSMVGFFPKTEGKSSEDLVAQVIYKGVVKSVEIVAPEKIVVPTDFPKWTRILEFRYGLTNGQPFVYTSESGRLMAEGELRAGFHLQHNNERAQKIGRLGILQLPKLVLFSCFAALTVGPVLFMIYSYKKRR